MQTCDGNILFLAISQEREAARQRYQRELEAVEETYQQQRRRLLQDVQEERASNARVLGEERNRMEQELKVLLLKLGLTCILSNSSHH